ncbi:MAG: hypothetical protein V4592_12455 [Bacteroidota bacterium]
MRTSLNRLQEIEGFVLRTANAGDALVFEARMIVDPNLAGEVNLQKDAYAIIHQYGRRKLKAELEAVHQQLFTQPKYSLFRQKIRALFK